MRPSTTRRGLALLGAGLSAGAQAQPVPEPLARFAAGTFLENLIVRPDGAVLFTSYFARRIERWSPQGAGVHAETPLFPVSLGLLPDGSLAVAGHGAPFVQGPAALRGTNALLVLGPDGALRRHLALPDAVFLNGLLVLPSGRLLVADSALGRIWEVAPETGGARPWIVHDSLAPSAGRPGIPGANGIKPLPDGRALLVSNSASGMLLRLGLDAAGAPAGAPEPVARFPGIDDFCVLPDGTVWAATHATALARLRPGAAAPETFPVPGLEGNTAVAPVPGAAALYVLGTGGLAGGGRGEAMLARVPLPG